MYGKCDHNRKAVFLGCVGVFMELPSFLGRMFETTTFGTRRLLSIVSSMAQSQLGRHQPCSSVEAKFQP